MLPLAQGTGSGKPLMALHIRDERAATFALRLADRKGVTMTEAVIAALEAHSRASGDPAWVPAFAGASGHGHDPYVRKPAAPAACVSSPRLATGVSLRPRPPIASLTEPATGAAVL
jgi:hypothetical protein